jgi:hypothetical protein
MSDSSSTDGTKQTDNDGDEVTVDEDGRPHYDGLQQHDDDTEADTASGGAPERP